MEYSKEVQQGLAAWRDVFQLLGPHLSGQETALTLDEARAAYIAFLATHQPPDNVRITDCNMGSVPATLVEPEQVRDGRILVYFHGGGYFSGAPAGYHGIAGHFANLLQARVYLPDYRLAPAHPFPAAIDDSLAAYRWLLDQGHPARSIMFAGDSAGGALTVSVMVRAREAGLPLPAAGAALSPWPNLENNGASMVTRDGLDPLANKQALDLLARTFLNGVKPTHPHASPIHADLHGLPPILVQAGENEVMLNDAMRLATHLGEQRVRTTLEVWPGMFHVWHLFSAILPDARLALQHAARFLEAQLR